MIDLQYWFKLRFWRWHWEGYYFRPVSIVRQCLRQIDLSIDQISPEDLTTHSCDCLYDARRALQEILDRLNTPKKDSNP